MKTQKFDKQFLAHIAAFVLLAFFSAPLVSAQSGRLVREKLHAASLEKTVTNESAERSVSVYLPPGYDASPAKRYPVLYLLHGIGDTDDVWVENKEAWTNIPYLMDKGVAEGRFGEMIIVMPDERTKWFGSFYMNSSVTGNWEDFTAKELVGYIDRKYRTISDASSRGIAGHSMGGYGAITLGMKHPEVFSVVYAMNPGMMAWGADFTPENPAFASVLAAKSYDNLQKNYAEMKGNPYTIALVTLGQAFSPNPNRPPFFIDFPFALVDGKLRPSEPGFSRWQANFPANMVERYKSNLIKLRGIRFDSGYEDEFRFIPPSSRAFSAVLSGNAVEHIFEEYNGDHRNRLWGQTGRIYTEVLPYFWFQMKSQNNGKRQ